VATSTRDLSRSLREARFRRWLELAEIEAELELPAEHLRALESEEFDLLPSDEYVRSTLRAYAGYLGLDSELYVEAYDSRLAAAEAARRRKRRRTIIRVPAILLFMGLVAAGGLGRSSFGGQDNERESPRRPSVTPTSSLGTETTSPSSQATTGQVSEPKQEQTDRTPKVAPTTRTTQVVLAAVRGDCWLSVRAGSPTGRLLYQGQLAQGRSIDFTRKRLWIRFGAASHVDLILNGKVMRDFAAGTVDAIVTSRGIRLETSLAGGA
jgi:hypothetical protein